MSPAEVQAARERLGLSQERLAAELTVTEAEVRGWEAGTVRIPGRFAQRLAWQAALKEREDLLLGAGLPECEWVQAWEREPIPEKLEQRTRKLEALSAHAEQCPTCQARARYAEEHLPPLPDAPMPLWIRVVGRFSERVERLPRWLRPAVYGAVLIGLLTLARAALALLVAGPSLGLLGMAAAGLLVGGYLGAVGGLAYHTVREPFRRFGRAGAYLTGVAVAAAYLLAFAIPELFLSDEPMLADPAGWLIGGVLAAVFGLMIGHWWFRDAFAPRPTGG